MAYLIGIPCCEAVTLTGLFLLTAVVDPCLWSAVITIKVRIINGLLLAAGLLYEISVLPSDQC